MIDYWLLDIAKNMYVMYIFTSTTTGTMGFIEHSSLRGLWAGF